MEPKHSSPEFNVPNPEQAVESLPDNTTPERVPEIPLPSVERGERSHESAAERSAQAQASLAAQPVPVALPTPIALPQDDSSQTVQADDLPAVASDEDLIEKEWVDKAKQIINQTKDDPARREKEVGRLQADYLRKRYGKELGASPE